MAVSRPEVEALVRAICSDTRLPVPDVVWEEGTEGSLSYDGSEVRLGVGLLDDPEDAAFTVAHELGHLALGHSGAVPKPVAAAGYVAGAVAAVAPWVLLAPRGAWGLCLVLLATVLALEARRSRRCEYEADAWAASSGFPLTPGLASRYRARYGEPKGGALWASHPSWGSRLAPPEPLPWAPRPPAPVVMAAVGAVPLLFGVFRALVG